MNSAERYRLLCAKGLNAHQIAARLKVNVNTVYQTCRRNGITLPSVLKGKVNSSWRRRLRTGGTAR